MKQTNKFEHNEQAQQDVSFLQTILKTFIPRDL